MATFHEHHVQQMARRVNAQISAKWLLTKPQLHSSHSGIFPDGYFVQ